MEFYRWTDEKIVATRMADVRRETEKIQLLEDAGLLNPGLLERMGAAIEKGLIKVGLRIRKNYSERQRAYQVTTSKYAA